MLIKIAPPTKGYEVGQWKRANGVSDSDYRAVLMELRSLAGIHTGQLDSMGLPWDERINTKNKSMYTERRTSMCAGQTVTIYNTLPDSIDFNTIDYDYYEAQANKLIEGMTL